MVTYWQDLSKVPAAAGIRGNAQGGRPGYRPRVTNRRHWLIVASLDHARRGVEAGFVMASHGKRGPLARMSTGDGVFIYSPKYTYPDGQPLRAITVIGRITGDQPEPSDAIAGGFQLRADLREIPRLGLDEIREHLPVSRIRFGFLELDPEDAQAILAMEQSHA